MEEGSKGDKRKMSDNTHGADLAQMNAEIAKSRKEIAVMAARLEKVLGGNNGKPGAEIEHSAFRQGLEHAGARGGEVAMGLAAEIKRHPLIIGVTALSLGFVIAMLIFKRSS
jgi:hypothetical protein